MHKEAIGRLLGDNKKAVAINVIVISNAFIWYSYAFNYLLTAINASKIESQLMLIITVHFTTLFAALLLGQFLSNKIKDRISFLLWWTLAGVFLSIVPLVTGIGYNGLLVFSVITGFNFGFGIPVCLGYFSSTTEANHRGKLGGILFLLIGVGSFVLSFIGTETLITMTLVLSIWRATGLLFLILLKPEKQEFSQKQMSYKSILVDRSFLLYFIPWTIFLFVNSLAFPAIQKHTNLFPSDLVVFSSHVEFVLAGLSGAVFGFFADSKGRKRLAVAGFSLLGVGYAILGFTQGAIVGWWIYTFIDGIAWGCFAMIFVFTVWGDLAEGRRSEKIYAIGLMPYLLSTFIRYSIGGLLISSTLLDDFASIFSFFSFFLFVAVLPLVFAQETLSEQTIKNNDLKNYVEKAQKKLSKVQGSQNNQNERDSSKAESQKESCEYKKAQELAEKYY